MILYKLGALPNDILLLKFQNFHVSHLSRTVALLCYSGTTFASGTFYNIPTSAAAPAQRERGHAQAYPRRSKLRMVSRPGKSR
jgi:hypothetical protein